MSETEDDKQLYIEHTKALKQRRLKEFFRKTWWERCTDPSLFTILYMGDGKQQEIPLKAVTRMEDKGIVFYDEKGMQRIEYQEMLKILKGETVTVE